MPQFFQKEVIAVINIVITGSRDWPMDKAHIIWLTLDKLRTKIDSLYDLPRIRFHHGQCPYGGADLIGASWAHGAGWEIEPHPAIKNVGWAYAKRNQEMIDVNPDYVIVCFLEGAGNKGTIMTYNMAVKAGLEDRIIEIRG